MRRVRVAVAAMALASLLASVAGGQEAVVSPNAQIPHLGVHGTFTVDPAELAASDPRNPKRVTLVEMTTFSFYGDLGGTRPIAQGCRYEYRGAAGDPYYYPARAKTSIWEQFRLASGEPACSRFSYVILRAPHGKPVHMHMRYGDGESSFARLLGMSDGPEDKKKLDPWWSVYCLEGVSGCDR